MMKLELHTRNLLKAIEGYSGAVAGSKEHEPIVSQLERIKEEALKGHSSAPPSPGQLAAQGAYQVDHPSEENHAPGQGNTRANAPAPPARRNERAPDVISEPNTADKITGAAPPESGGMTRSALPAHGFSGGEAQIRRVAAERELSRPDTKMRATAEKNKPGGQKESVAPAPPAPKGPRIGNVHAPEITNTQRHGEAAKAGREAQKQPEATPPYAKQGLGGDGWKGAEARMKSRLKQAIRA